MDFSEKTFLERKISEGELEFNNWSDIIADAYVERDKVAKRIQLYRELLAIYKGDVAQAAEDSAIYPAEWDEKPYDYSQNSRGRKLDDEKALRIRELYASGKWSMNALSHKYKISAGGIGHVLTHKNFQHAGGPVFYTPLHQFYRPKELHAS